MSAEPDALDDLIIDGEDERPGSIQLPPPKRRRTRSKRTAETIDKIAQYVSEGMPLKAACSASGTSYSSLWRWKSGPGGQEIADKLERAEASFIEVHLKIIRQAAAKGTWVASAWLLERKFPELFGRRLQTERHVDQRITVENSAEELRAFERRMEELIPNEQDRKAFAVELLRLAAPDATNL